MQAKQRIVRLDRWMPKIAIVANTDWYIFNFRSHLIQELIKEGWEVVVVSPKGEYTQRLLDMGIRHIEWDVQRQSISPVTEIRSILQLKKIYQAEKPAIIHHHTNKAVIYGNLASFFSKRMDLQSIVDSIAGIGYIGTKGIKPSILRSFVFLLYKIIRLIPAKRAIIFENNDDLDLFTKNMLVDESKSRFIGGIGVNMDCFPYVQYKPNTKFLVLYVGRLLWSKGVGIFVEAAEKLRNSGRFKFVIVGKSDAGNPDSISDDQIAYWKKQGAIEYWGWFENMADIYQQADFVIVPTTYGEGIPTVVLEACASGRIVIASDWSGCREVIENGMNGYLVEPYSVDSVVEKITFLSQQEKINLERVGLRARETIVEKFTVDITIKKTMEVYHSLLT